MSTAWPSERALEGCEVGEEGTHEVNSSGRYTGKGKGSATAKGPVHSNEKATKRSDVGGDSSKAFDQSMPGDTNDGVKSNGNGLIVQHRQDDSDESRRGYSEGESSDNEAYGDAVNAGSPSGETTVVQYTVVPP